MTNHRILRALFNPRKIVTALWRRIPIGSYTLRIACDAVERPHYAYAIHEAAKLAKQLGFAKFSIVEFGVAGGNGLVAMEKIAGKIEKALDIEIEIYGFDAGGGLPQPVDYRDLPYEYGGGQYAMDEAKLRARLGRAKLILGDVKDTVADFFESHGPAPIGFVAIDLDFYSSTLNALKIFDAGPENLLPRVFCYLDDTVGPDWVLSNEWVGELAAVKEFNERHERRKIAPIHGLGHKRVVRSDWNDTLFAFHDFDHALYNTYISPLGDPQLPLHT